MSRKSQEQFERKKESNEGVKIAINILIFSILGFLIYLIFFGKGNLKSNMFWNVPESFQCLESENKTILVGFGDCVKSEFHGYLCQPIQLVTYDNSTKDEWIKENRCAYIEPRYFCTEYEGIYVTEPLCTLQCTPDKSTCQWLNDGQVVKEGKDCFMVDVEVYHSEGMVAFTYETLLECHKYLKKNIEYEFEYGQFSPYDDYSEAT